MEIKIFESSGTVLVRIRGRIILDECDRLKSTIVPLISPQITRLHLDLTNVEFIDSAGLGVLVGIKVSANKHRSRLSLINPSRGVSDILMVSKLDSIFEIVTGAEAERLIMSLDQPHLEKAVAGTVQPPASRGPAMPSMPSSSGIRPSGVVATPASPAAAGPAPAAAAGNLKDRLDRLCKEAVEFMRRGDYDNAADSYKQAIEISPDYLPAHNNLAIVYEKRPHWHQLALEQWRRVLDLSMRNNDHKHIDRAQKHLANLERLEGGGGG